jgi:cysteine desulfurase
MKKPLYLDHQATTPVDFAVLEAMKPFWYENFGNPHSSGHVIGWHSNAQIEKAKQQISRFIGASAGEIFFTSGATESNNLAAFSLCDFVRLNPHRQQILLSPIDHKCILNAGLFWADKFELKVKFLKVDTEGYIDLDYLSESLKTPSLFCSIGYVNNEVGTIQDIKTISKIVRETGCLLHSDAAQAPKTVECDTLAHLTDLLSFSGHKIGGPQGIGFLYVNAQVQDSMRPLIHGGGQQNGFRSGTLPLPLCVGIGKACELLTEPQAIENRRITSEVRDHFYQELLDLRTGITLNGPPLSERHAGNLNISFEGVDATELLMSLQPNVCASTGSACASGEIEASHVLSALGLSDDRCGSALRFSFSHDMKMEEANQAVQHLADCLK